MHEWSENLFTTTAELGYAIETGVLKSHASVSILEMTVSNDADGMFGANQELRSLGFFFYVYMGQTVMWVFILRLSVWMKQELSKLLFVYFLGRNFYFLLLLFIFFQILPLNWYI